MSKKAVKIITSKGNVEKELTFNVVQKLAEISKRGENRQYVWIMPHGETELLSTRFVSGRKRMV